MTNFDGKEGIDYNLAPGRQHGQAPGLEALQASFRAKKARKGQQNLLLNFCASDKEREIVNLLYERISEYFDVRPKVPTPESFMKAPEKTRVEQIALRNANMKSWFDDEITRLRKGDPSRGIEGMPKQKFNESGIDVNRPAMKAWLDKKAAIRQAQTMLSNTVTEWDPYIDYSDGEMKALLEREGKLWDQLYTTNDITWTRVFMDKFNAAMPEVQSTVDYVADDGAISLNLPSGRLGDFVDKPQPESDVIVAPDEIEIGDIISQMGQKNRK